MKANEILKKIMTELSVVEVKFETQNLKNGTTLEAEAFEAGNEIFIVSEEDRVAVPVGEYELEDGRILVVAEEGLIAEIKEATEEEEAPASEEAAPAEEAPVEEVQAAEEEPVKEESTLTEDRVREMIREEFTKIMDEMQKEEEVEMKADEVAEAPVEEKIEMSADEPAAKPIKHSPEAKAKSVDLGSMKRHGSTLDRVMSKMSK